MFNALFDLDCIIIVCEIPARTIHTYLSQNYFLLYFVAYLYSFFLPRKQSIYREIGKLQ